jgi:hypothetical protein
MKYDTDMKRRTSTNPFPGGHAIMFQRLSGRRAIVAAVVVLLGILASEQPAAADSYVTTTLAEDYQANDLLVVCRLVARRGTDDDLEGTFEVIEALKGAERLAARADAKTPYRFTSRCSAQTPVNSTCMAFGLVEKELEWGYAFDVTKRSIEYVRRLPKLAASGTQRIAAFLPYLEDDEPLLSIDAHRELVNAGLESWRKARDVLPRTKLLQWIADPKVSLKHRRLYLDLLGVCGTADDLTAVRALVESKDPETRKLLDASLSCYLLLAGEAGMSLVEELSFLKKASTEYVDAYAVIVALRFVSQQPTSLPQARIVAVMRSYLERPQFADLVIPDLARLKDWDSAPRLMELFRGAGTETPWIRTPAVNFMRASPRADAKEFLAEMRRLDPEVVKKVEAWPNIAK